MEEKLLKVMAQLGLVAILIWVLAGAFGRRDEAVVSSPPCPKQPRAKGDVWQRSCIEAPYAQGTFEPGLYMGAHGGLIAANQFTSFSYEGNSLSGVKGIYATGTGFFNRNVFEALSIWDELNGTAVDMSYSAKMQNNAFIGTLNGGTLVQYAGYATNLLIDAGSSTISLPAGLANSWTANTITANSGVSGQGGTLLRDGGSGGVQLSPAGSITGVNRAVSLVDSSDNSRISVLGNGSALLGGSLVQIAGTLGGSCTMSAGTSCTVSITGTFVNTPLCVATEQSATVVAAGCVVTGSGSSWTLTVSAASSNSAKWAAFVFGNPE